MLWWPLIIFSITRIYAEITLKDELRRYIYLLKHKIQFLINFYIRERTLMLVPTNGKRKLV